MVFGALLMRILGEIGYLLAAPMFSEQLGDERGCGRCHVDVRGHDDGGRDRGDRDDGARDHGHDGGDDRHVHEDPGVPAASYETPRSLVSNT